MAAPVIGRRRDRGRGLRSAVLAPEDDGAGNPWQPGGEPAEGAENLGIREAAESYLRALKRMAVPPPGASFSVRRVVAPTSWRVMLTGSGLLSQSASGPSA